MATPKLSMENSALEERRVRVPNLLFLICVGSALLVPYLARLPGVFIHGSEWLQSYVTGIGAILFLCALSAIHGVALYVVGKISKKNPLTFWFAFGLSVGYLLWAHGSINLSASSTAAIGLIFIPVSAAFIVGAGAVVGWGINKLISPEGARLIVAWFVCVTSVIAGIANGVEGQSETAQRESKFPVVALNEIGLSNRPVFVTSGRVEELVFDNFDMDSDQEIAVFGEQGITFLNPKTYETEFISNIKGFSCAGCVGMYTQIVADGKGGFVVANSDGVVDGAGKTIFQLQHESFSRIIPLRLSGADGMTYFSHETPSLMRRHDAHGKVLWDIKGGVLGLGVHENAAGERNPFVVSARTGGAELSLLGFDGQTSHKIQLPNGFDRVVSVPWPSRGHYLAGNAGNFAVLDANGKQILAHSILNTSFRPYHGPDAVAVKLNPQQQPYLAVMIHGSSGYARSALLVFDPTGRLVFQEERNKLRSILAVPRSDGKGEVLLVGGMDGVIEYQIEPAGSAENKVN